MPVRGRGLCKTGIQEAGYKGTEKARKKRNNTASGYLSEVFGEDIKIFGDD